MKNKTKLSLEASLPVILSAAGAIGVAPFAVIRFVNGDWATGLLDTAIVTGLVVLGMFVLRTHRVRAASVLLALLCVAGALATLVMRGSAQIYWMYPAILAVFYLLQMREAMLLSVVAIAAAAAILWPSVGTISLTTMVITLLVTVAFASAFSVLTETQRAKLSYLAASDPLTGAGNRRALEERLQAFIASQPRSNATAALIMLDIDHFKRVNDRHGHDVGDDILCQVTRIVRERIRSADGLYRIGGEEFVVFADGDDINNGARLAEDLRQLVADKVVGVADSATISLGIAEYVQGETREAWLRRTDEAMYAAKRAGRNCIQLAS